MTSHKKIHHVIHTCNYWLYKHSILGRKTSIYKYRKAWVVEMFTFEWKTAMSLYLIIIIYDFLLRFACKLMRLHEDIRFSLNFDNINFQKWKKKTVLKIKRHKYNTTFSTKLFLLLLFGQKIKWKKGPKNSYLKIIYLSTSFGNLCELLILKLIFIQTLLYIYKWIFFWIMIKIMMNFVRNVCILLCIFV